MAGSYRGGVEKNNWWGRSDTAMLAYPTRSLSSLRQDFVPCIHKEQGRGCRDAWAPAGSHRPHRSVILIGKISCLTGQYLQIWAEASGACHAATDPALHTTAHVLCFRSKRQMPL